MTAVRMTGHHTKKRHPKLRMTGHHTKNAIPNVVQCKKCRTYSGNPAFFKVESWYATLAHYLSLFFKVFPTERIGCK
jgi:hypothetical protein